MTAALPNLIPKTTTAKFSCLEDITLSLTDILKPSERLTVSEAAAKYRKLNNRGAYQGDWKNSKVPYLRKPADMLASPEHEGVIFVGPAQCGKTDGLILNWLAYAIKCVMLDMIIYSPTTAAARDFSLRRIDRLHLHSPEIGSMLSSERDSDNRLDKRYKSGTMLSLSHPSQTEMAGKPVPLIALTDLDRMPEDVEGDGSPYDLGSKRTTTFGSYAMTLAESSPSFPIEDLRWIAKTPHEAPPAKGIFSLYNRGDRRRWYWPCPQCGRYFEGEWKHLVWNRNLATVKAQADSAIMVCPHGGCEITPDDRFEMNLWGTWLRDGESFTPDGRIIGHGEETMIASFWLRGVAAAFVSWPKLVALYIAAENEYQSTGSEEALKKFFNTDLAEPYIPKSAETQRIPEYIKSRAEDLGEKVVPHGVRLLIATVDVQKNAFVVQVHGICPGTPCDLVIVDRFTILKSNRKDDDDDPLWVKPAAYAEDWDLITEQVIEKTYPLADDSGRKMMVKMTLCDSGGKAGVTSMAYEFYRKLRRAGKHGRFHLLKGESKPGQPRARISFPDAQDKNKMAAARGDVPVLMLQSNLLKDALNGRLDCIEPLKGMIRFPNWLPDWFFAELCSEIRTNKGWEKIPHVRNEAWDLLYYVLGAIASKLLLLEQIDWNNPPSWAADWDKNDMILMPDQDEKFAAHDDDDYDLEKLAELLA